MQGAKHTLTWQGTSATLPKNKVKLLLNLVALGVVALPRGGAVGVEIKGEAPAVKPGARPRRACAAIGACDEPACRRERPYPRRPFDPALLRKPHCAAAGMTVSVETRDKEVELRAA